MNFRRRKRVKAKRAVVYTADGGRHVTRWPDHAAVLDALTDGDTPEAKAFFCYADDWDGSTYLVNVMQATVIATEWCSRPLTSGPPLW